MTAEDLARLRGAALVLRAAIANTLAFAETFRRHAAERERLASELALQLAEIEFSRSPA